MVLIFLTAFQLISAFIWWPNHNERYNGRYNSNERYSFKFRINDDDMLDSWYPKRNFKDLDEESPNRELQANGCFNDQYRDSITDLCIMCHAKFPFCVSCTENVCKECIDNASLDLNGKCIACGSFCSSCNETDCIECSPGSIKDDDGLCIQCPLGCQECNKTSCILCNSESYFNELGDCSSCSPKFLNCRSCNSTACQECINGHFLQSDGSCKTKPDYCKISSSEGVCLECNQGFFVDNNGEKCSSCSKNCLDCNSTSCINCKMSYYLDTYGKCSKCKSNCKDCLENCCIECKTGYFLESAEKCTLCSEKFGDLCRSCSSYSCSDCRSGFYIGPNGTCMKCSDKFEGCYSCDSEKCDSCSFSYYMESTENCSPCSSGCRKCLNSTVCTSCLNGKIPYSDGTCDCYGVGMYRSKDTNKCGLCSDGCMTCSSPQDCTKCVSIGMANNGDGTCSYTSYSYIYENALCNPYNSKGCKACKRIAFNGKDMVTYKYICTSCKDTYTLENGKCNHCSVNCAECGEYGECIKCVDPNKMIINDEGEGCVCRPGYLTHSRDSCEPCQSGCAHCQTGSDYCLLCFDSNYMIKNWGGSCSCVFPLVFNQTSLRCEHSTPHCAEYGTSGCIKCEQEYFLYDNSGALECLSCSESCNSCTPHPGCYLCGASIEKEESTCSSDDSIEYQTHFSNGNFILDFAYDMPKSLSIREIIIKSPGVYDTSSWAMTQISPRQYMIATNLKESDLPIDVRFKFNRNKQ